MLETDDVPVAEADDDNVVSEDCVPSAEIEEDAVEDTEAVAETDEVGILVAEDEECADSDGTEDDDGSDDIEGDTVLEYVGRADCVAETDADEVWLLAAVIVASEEAEGSLEGVLETVVIAVGKDEIDGADDSVAAAD